VKAQVLERYPHIEALVEVAYPPVFASPDGAARLDAAFPYVLYVGSRSPHKNFWLLVDGLREARGAGHDIGLAVLGPVLAQRERARLSAALPADRLVAVADGSSALRTVALRQAIALCMPSVAEGFGMPIVEAFQTGTPCLLSDIEVFREVAQDAAEYHGPTDPSALAAGLLRIVDDAALADRLVAAGHARLEELSPERGLAAVAGAYRAVSAR
jgi:glycosyltransferase involved in cell wall biosynthesis